MTQMISCSVFELSTMISGSIVLIVLVTSSVISSFNLFRCTYTSPLP